jgi:hypothetical protein
VSLAAINLGYGAEGSFQKLRGFDFVSSHLTVARHGLRENAFQASVAGSFPVPLPANYVRGLDLQEADFNGRYLSYLGGELRMGGWWYFYIYGLLVKTPIGTLLLMATALATAAAARPRRFDDLCVWLPVAAVFLAASAKTGFTMHFRYVLPALPFVFVGISKLAAAAGVWTRRIAFALAGAAVLSSLSVAPHWLAYFNEAAGGPRHGAAHLIDSNLDWGQDLLRLRDWIQRHPDARPLFLSYTNFVPHSIVALGDVGGVPTRMNLLVPGWYVVDIESLYKGNGQIFRTRPPTDRIGYSLLAYHLTETDIVQMRAARPANAPEFKSQRP